MGGLACMEVLRDAAPGLQTIVSSGYSTDPAMANYRKHGFAGVLPKPFGIQQLADMLVQIGAVSSPQDD
jgi:DNA-binding NtrC family response regulator